MLTPASDTLAPKRTVRHRIGGLVLASVLAAAALIEATPATAAPPAGIEPGSTYVALGSSYAAGAGLGPADPADVGGLCGRALSTYPYLIADALDLRLVNVSCGGATIDNIVDVPQQLAGPSGSRLADPQLNAVTADTRLVTITVGGNDVKYVTRLVAEACLGDLAQNPNSEFGNLLLGYGVCAIPDQAVVDAALDGLRDEFVEMIQAIQVRAPQARIVLVDYLTIVPRNGKPCANVPIPRDRQQSLQKVADKLNLATRVAGQRTGVDVVAASRLSRDHDACASDPWTTGYEASLNMMHPKATGHAAITDAVLQQLQTRHRQR